MYGYLYISPDNEDTPTGAVFYYNFHADEARCVWMVPTPCYPEPDIGAIIDALRHARW